MIKAICFDLDGVYFLNGKAAFINAIEKLGVPRVEVERVFLKSDEMNHQYKEGKMSDDEFWSWATKEWNIEKSPQELVDMLIVGYEINNEAAEYVRELHSKGYKTLICSNNFPARIAGLNGRFNFLQDFDAAVFSYEVGASKPDKKIFEELILRTGLRPDEIAYSDDDVTKLTGAHTLGMQTFVYTDFENFKKDLLRLGVS